MTKRGRKEIRRDEELAAKIQEMRQYGLTMEEVASLTSLSIPTLYKLYDQELKVGQAAANLVVGKKLFERCKTGDVAALIFWAKTRMGWKETQKVDLTSSDGSMAPLPQAIQIVGVEIEKRKEE